MAVVGVADVEVRPSFRGLQTQVGREMRGVGRTMEDQSGPGLGARLMSGIGRGLRRTAQVTGVAVGGILATALVKGWQRLTAIEDAEAKLRGLGHTASDIESIMDNALNAVLGTAFGMDEAATVAASAVAAGIQPGQDLEDVLRLTADAATVAGVGMDEMGSIFNKVASSNKVQGDVIAQLHDRGIPIIQMLAKELGTSVEETYRLASAGEIGFDTFRAAMEDGLGGAAQSAGDTTTGAFANMMAALSRFGAQLLTGVYPLAKHVFGGITSFLDDLTLGIEPLVTGLSERLVDGLKAFAGAWSGTTSDVEATGFVGFMQRFRDTARGVFDSVVGWITRFRDGWKDSADDVERSGIAGFFERFALAAGDAGSMASTTGGIVESLSSIFAGVAQVLPGLIESGLRILSDVLGWVADNMHIIAPLLPIVAGGFLAWRAASFGLTVAMTRLQAAQVAMAPVMLTSNLARLAAVRAEQRLALATGTTTAATTTQTGAMRGKAAATAVATGAQRGLNAAMRANPIGAIITAITLLIGALVWFFTQTELGQAIWQNVWNGIKTATAAVVDWFQTHVVPVLERVWNAIATGAMWLYENAIRPAWDGIMLAVRVASAWIRDKVVPILLTAWNAVASGISWLYENVAKPLFRAFSAAFNTAASVIQWIWNGVLKPTFTLVGDIIVWLWNNMARPYFQRIQDGWNLLKDALVYAWHVHIRPMIHSFGAWIKDLWQNQIQPRLQRIQDRWNLLKDALVYAWKVHIQPMLKTFGEWAKRLYNEYVKPALNWISDRWDWLSGKISDFWENTIKPVLNAFGDFIKEDVPDMVETGVEMIDKAWRKVANFFRDPINGVINFVWNDGIKAAFDAVAKAVNSDARLAEIPEIPEFARGGHHRGGWAVVGEEGPELAYFGSDARILTASQTRNAFVDAYSSRGEDVPEDAERSLLGGSPAQSLLPAGNWFTDAASGAWDWVSDTVSGAISWVRGGLAKAAETLLKPVKDTVVGIVENFGSMGKLAGGLADWGFDQLMDWIRGEDTVDEDSADYTQYTGDLGSFFRPSAGPITSRYGPRWGSHHAGIDIAGGGRVYAPWNGRVVRTGSNIGPGRTGQGILLSHGNNVWTYTGHHPYGAIRVRAGDRVSAGDWIGAQGATGNVTGVHTHFELHRGRPWADVNPGFLFDKGGVVQPGTTMIHNQLRQPEALLNPGQWRDMHSIAQAVADSGVGEGINLTQINNDSRSRYADAQDLRFAMRQEMRKSRKVGV